MKISGLKNQQCYLMKKIDNLSDELVNVIELLELVSQIVEQDEEESEDDDEEYEENREDDDEEYEDEFNKKLSKILKEQNKHDYYKYKSKRTIEVNTDSEEEIDNKPQLLETYLDEN
jgi:hypothetical protein